MPTNDTNKELKDNNLFNMDTQTINQIIQKYQNILLLPEKDVQINNFKEILLLFYTLKKMGKNVNVLMPAVPKKYQFLNPFIVSSLSFPMPTDRCESKEFIISINVTNKDVSEMRYEKNEDNLKLYLFPKKGEIRKEDISFPNLEERPELIINLVTKKIMEPSLTTFQKNNSNQLIEQKVMGDGFFSKVSTLTINTNQINEGGYNNTPQIKLLNKVLEKLDFNQEKHLSFISLEYEDFQELSPNSGTFCQIRDSGEKKKTETEKISNGVKFVVSELINFWQIPSFFILWENQPFSNPKKGLFYSSEGSLIEKILENFAGITKGKGVMFLVRESSLTSAKEKVLEVL